MIGAKMIVNAELFVNDLPGQLIGSIEPISMVNGNILGVVHNRDRIVDNRICVNVTFEVGDRQLERLKELWKARDIVISSLGSVHETFTMHYILIGDVNAQYIEGLLKKVNEAIGYLKGMIDFLEKERMERDKGKPATELFIRINDLKRETEKMVAESERLVRAADIEHYGPLSKYARPYLAY